MQTVLVDEKPLSLAHLVMLNEIEIEVSNENFPVMVTESFAANMMSIMGSRNI
jgi:hypothetical protein